MANDKPTLKQVVEQVLSELGGPITVKDLADRVYAIYPTRSKTAMSSFRNCLRYDERGINLVYLNKDTILPMQIAMQGIRFRVPIDRQAEKESIIPLLFFNYFIDREPKPQNVSFTNSQGNPLIFKSKQSKTYGNQIPCGEWISLMRLSLANGSTSSGHNGEIAYLSQYKIGKAVNF